MLSRLTQAKEKIRSKKHGHSQKGENAARLQDYKQPAERATRPSRKELSNKNLPTSMVHVRFSQDNYELPAALVRFGDG
ncbi:unnamed protein product, partial [Rhizoctonia solani]